MRHFDNFFGALVAFTLTVGCGGGDEFKSNDTQNSAGGTSGSGGGAQSGGGGMSTDAAAGGSTMNAGGSGATMPDAGAGGTTVGEAGTTIEAGPGCTDNDDDSVTTCDGDCDDSDPTSYPGANEICGDDADNDCNGTADDGCNGLGTFVSTMTGDDSNPGTKTLPVRTIAEGIQRALSIGGGPDVYIAGGPYAEKVTLEEDVSLLGGYDCTAQPCSWARDINGNVSEIENPDVEGVVAGHQITRVTIVDGFTITGLDTNASTIAPGTAAVTILGGAPTLTRNTIVGGSLTGGSYPYNRAVGIAVLTASGANTQGPLIDSNTIEGGQSSDSSAGILFEARPSVTGVTYGEVRRNVIRGGDATFSTGIMAWTSDASVVVEQNDIVGGTSAATGGNAGSWGILVGGSLTISKNRINTRSGSSATCSTYLAWCGGIKSESSTTIITNNVIWGANSPWSAGVDLEEVEKTAGDVILNANYIDGAGSGAQVSSSAAVRLFIGSCDACGYAGVVGKIRNNILAGGTGAARSGVLEDPSSGKQIHPVALENNQFFVTPGTYAALYRYNDGTSSTATLLTTISDVNNLATSIPALVVSANQSGDPVFDASYHLTSGSPCIDKGTATEAPSDDFEGDDRPQGSEVDIGPDEVKDGN